MHDCTALVRVLPTLAGTATRVAAVAWSVAFRPFSCLAARVDELEGVDIGNTSATRALPSWCTALSVPTLLLSAHRRQVSVWAPFAFVVLYTISQDTVRRQGLTGVCTSCIVVNRPLFCVWQTLLPSWWLVMPPLLLMFSLLGVCAPVSLVMFRVGCCYLRQYRSTDASMFKVRCRVDICMHGCMHACLCVCMCVCVRVCVPYYPLPTIRVAFLTALPLSLGCDVKPTQYLNYFFASRSVMNNVWAYLPFTVLTALPITIAAKEEGPAARVVSSPPVAVACVSPSPGVPPRAC
jgi:hypothetical protein